MTAARPTAAAAHTSSDQQQLQLNGPTGHPVDTAPCRGPAWAHSQKSLVGKAASDSTSTISVPINLANYFLGGASVQWAGSRYNNADWPCRCVPAGELAGRQCCRATKPTAASISACSTWQELCGVCCVRSDGVDLPRASTSCSVAIVVPKTAVFLLFIFLYKSPI